MVCKCLRVRTLEQQNGRISNGKLRMQPRVVKRIILMRQHLHRRPPWPVRRIRLCLPSSPLTIIGCPCGMGGCFVDASDFVHTVRTCSKFAVRSFQTHSPHSYTSIGGLLFMYAATSRCVPVSSGKLKYPLSHVGPL